MSANFRRLVQAARHKDKGTLFAPNLTELKSPRGSWVYVGAEEPESFGLYSTLSEYGDPEQTMWDGSRWGFMGQHTDTILLWWKVKR